MKRIFLILLLITTKLTFGQTNGGFEIWDTTYTNAYSSDLTNLFAVPNPLGGIVNSWTSGSSYGISRTTDSYSGNYSLILHNWYNYALEWIIYHDSMSYRPLYLQGYFKYISGGSDPLSQGTAKVTLTRFNGTSNDTIANGTYLFDSTAYFTPFQLTLNYISGLYPDSINIYIINGNSSCGTNMVCNLLYLDNLTLTNSPLGIENVISNESVVSIFPNPQSANNDILNLFVEEEAQASVKEIIIYDIMGKVILNQRINKQGQISLNTGINSAGTYIVRIITEKGIGTRKYIVY